MIVQTIKVKHNFEAAHRLFLTHGKCERIHGHSFKVQLELGGDVNSRGLLCGLDFGQVKAGFRNYLDTDYDHAILLNVDDPLAGNLNAQDTEGWFTLPGLKVMSVDPTTENLAARIGIWAQGTFARFGVTMFDVTVWETDTNCGTWTNWIKNA
jgi:6-pyruvoyltetrahydropterin/6-carboxytetrahydropterin synthase